jgi:hypothetical protein
MKGKIGCKNCKLTFSSESSMNIFTSPVSDYFKDFPFENYDFELISSRHPEELSKLVDELDKYFKTFKPTFQFPTGFVSVPHEIWIDRTRKKELKNGFIPVYVSFVSPNIPPSKGEFSW